MNWVFVPVLAGVGTYVLGLMVPPTCHQFAISVAVLKKKGFPNRCVTALLQGTVSPVQVLDSEGESNLAVGSQETQNHTTQPPFPKRFIGRGKNRRVSASARARSSREVSTRQGLCRIGGVCFPG